MKRNNVLLLSLIVNAGLAFAAFKVFSPTEPSPPAPAPEVITTKPKAEIRKAAQPKRSAPKPDAVPAKDFQWALLEAEDFKVYIANLRAVSCPEETIRDIITAEVNKLYAPRVAEVSPWIDQKYWQSGRRFMEAGYYEKQTKMRALEKEKSDLLKELLGVDPNEEAKKDQNYVDYWQKNYDFIKDDRRDKVREIQEKYNMLQQEIYRTGFHDEEDQAKLKELYKQQLAEMGSILSPSELQEYDLRASQVANQMRYDLDVFGPTEQEFRSIYAIRKEREDDLRYPSDPDDKAQQERRAKAVEETDAVLKGLLGEQRFAEYKRSQDHSYKELVRLAEKQDLPKDTATKVYDIKQAAEDAVKKLREDKNLSSAERTAALKAIRQETEKVITEALGAKTVERYQNRGGWWIRNLAPEVR